MKILYICAIFISSILLAPNVSADGNELLKQCLATERFLDTNKITNGVDVGRCFGIGQGVRQSMVVLKEGIIRACFPEKGINNGQATRIIVSYLKKNPSKLHKHEVLLIMLAYADAYPCE